MLQHGRFGLVRLRKGGGRRRQTGCSEKVWVKVGYGLDVVWAQLRVDNVGHLTARNVQGQFTVRIEAIPSRRQIGSDVMRRLEPEPLQAITLGSENGHISRDYSIPGLDGRTFQSVRRLEKTIRMAGHFSCDDGLGTVVPKYVC